MRAHLKQIWSSEHAGLAWKSLPLVIMLILAALVMVNVLIIAGYSSLGRDRVIAEMTISSIITLITATPLVMFSVGQHIRIKILAASLRRLSLVDPLTGLANRRSLFDGVLDKDAAENGAFIFLDIDHFKSINDGHGHKGGDDVLAAFARLIAARVPGNATCARLGGEEFGIFLPGASRQDALAVAHTIVADTARMQVVSQEGRQIIVTVSAGVAFGRSGIGADELIAEADKALYGAKNAGRNRVLAAA
jgi:diguanylate cyclase (GGDEF)-like protein